MPRKPSASRSRARRIGLLGLLLTVLLTPAGIIVGAVTAAALVGGAFHLNRAASDAPATPPHSLSVKTGQPQHLSIEDDGKPVILVMTEDEIGAGGGVNRFDPASPLFAGLAGNRPVGAVREGLPRGIAPSPPPLAGPLGSGHTPATGPLPNDVPKVPTGGPSSPPVAGGPHPATGNDEPHGEPSGPTKPEKILPPLSFDLPPQGNPPLTTGLPEETLPGPDTLPGTSIPPLAGNPLDTLTSPPGTQSGARTNAVPEPSLLGLMLLGGIAMAWAGRRRARGSAPADRAP